MLSRGRNGGITRRTAPEEKNRALKQYSVRVVYSPSKDADKALAKAYRYAFARVLEKMRSEKGERLC